MLVPFRISLFTFHLLECHGFPEWILSIFNWRAAGPFILALDQFPEVQSSDTESLCSQNINIIKKLRKDDPFQSSESHFQEMIQQLILMVISIQKSWITISLCITQNLIVNHITQHLNIALHFLIHPLKSQTILQIHLTAWTSPTIILPNTIHIWTHLCQVWSFSIHLGSSHPDGLVSFGLGPVCPTIIGRCVCPARTSCNSCADAFGDSDCCFQFCAKML